MRTNVDDIIGKTANVVMAIPAGEAGRVALKGTTWRAVLDDETATAAVGERVVVLSIEGVTLTALPPVFVPTSKLVKTVQR